MLLYQISGFSLHGDQTHHAPNEFNRWVLQGLQPGLAQHCLAERQPMPHTTIVLTSNLFHRVHSTGHSAILACWASSLAGEKADCMCAWYASVEACRTQTQTCTFWRLEATAALRQGCNLQAVDTVMITIAVRVPFTATLLASVVHGQNLAPWCWSSSCIAACGDGGTAVLHAGCMSDNTRVEQRS